MADKIRIQNAALDEVTGGEIVLRGRIAPESLHLLRVDDYQREQLSWSVISKMAEVMKTTVLPDVDLGMRGQRVETEKKTGDYLLLDPVYIIDGLQRTTAALSILKSGISPRLGAMVRFGTDAATERALFEALNLQRNRLSPNILLRNQHHDSPAIDCLKSLSEKDKDFALFERVCWKNSMGRNHLLSARSYLISAAWLHARFGPGRNTKMSSLGPNLDKVFKAIGRNTLRDNIRAFYDLIDSAWGIRRIAYKDQTTYLRGGFLYALALLLARHTDFWRNENHLFVDKSLLSKISQFPIHDPEVQRLSGTSGQARHLLYTMLLEHVNSGKRNHRLTTAPLWDELPDTVEPVTAVKS